MRTFSQSLKRTQLGVSLLELLTVVSIVGIIAYAGVPQFSGIITERDLNTAKTTLLQSLHKAKNIAQAESTIVTVDIQNNTISLTPNNSSPTQTMRMPQQIGVNNAINFNFNATGLAVDINNNAVNESITIQATTNSGLNETVTISTTGLIASL